MGRFLAALVVGLALSLPAAAQQRRAEWIKDWVTECLIWNPAPKAGERVRWMGPCVDGFAEGAGDTTWLVNGKWTETFAGTYRRGHPDGRMTLRRADGSISEVAFVNGRVHGPFKVRYHDGSIEAGTHINGQLQGPFTVHYASGIVETGTFVDGRRSGAFTQRHPNEDVVTGTYVNDEWHGTVTTIFRGGRSEKDFRGGRETGNVRYAWSDGATYSGGWVNGRAHGRGTYTAPHGQVYEGQWSNGCFRQGGRWAMVNATREECGPQQSGMARTEP